MSASSAPEIVSKSCLVLNLWNKTDFFKKYPSTNIYIIASGKWADFVCVCFRVVFLLSLFCCGFLFFVVVVVFFIFFLV